MLGISLHAQASNPQVKKDQHEDLGQSWPPLRSPGFELWAPSPWDDTFGTIGGQSAPEAFSHSQAHTRNIHPLLPVDRCDTPLLSCIVFSSDKQSLYQTKPDLSKPHNSPFTELSIQTAWMSTALALSGGIMMRIPATVLFFCSLFSLTPATTEVGLAGKVLLFPYETDFSYVKLTPKKPLALTAFTLCMRVATELQGERQIILFAYRTPDYDELNVWRERDGRLSFYLRGDGAFFHLPPLTTFRAHLCLTWSARTGLAAAWLDGKRSAFQLYKPGHSVRPQGTVLLGQDPDKHLGDFETMQSFAGELTDLNMWDQVLTGSQIKALYANQAARVPKGTVFDWSSIQYEIKGNVLVVPDD
ncbi:hypothetical protein DNTS_005727 [Danionella cerebrum]|uniref:Pentraxin (PTX) domain-containing protein n=1 Tax=Danionella cerebrum TaxID=2873325 RepID=A0A553QSM7_9TELE|nr:hypothetical protein DNTS_005727 [Danionella translucida]